MKPLFKILGFSIAITSLIMSLLTFLLIFFGRNPYYIEPNKIIISLEIALVALGLVWMLGEVKSLYKDMEEHKTTGFFVSTNQENYSKRSYCLLYSCL